MCVTGPFDKHENVLVELEVFPTDKRNPIISEKKSRSVFRNIGFSLFLKAKILPS